MHSWQNGTRCRDGVKLLWCHSYLVWLVFEGSILTCACFHSENFFCDLFLLGFVFFGSLLGMVTEKRRGRVGRGEDAWCVQYDSTELFCSQKTKNCHKVKCFQVKLSIQTSNFFIWGVLNPKQSLIKTKCKAQSLMRLCMQAYKSRAHFMWTTNGFTEKLSIDCHHRVLSRKTPLQEQFDGE